MSAGYESSRARIWASTPQSVWTRMAMELVGQGRIVTKPTHYGQQVSLNPREHEEIVAFMKMHFPDVE